MNIVILGAGQVGQTVAERLESEANDIVLVDQRSDVLADIREKLDVRTVTGHAAHPGVLARAGTQDGDLLLAITNSDETNIVACQMARFVFNTPTCLARIRSPEYLDHPELFSAGSIPIDHLISPEHLVTTYIRHVIERPNVLQAADFVDGNVQLLVIRANAGGTLVGQRLRGLTQRLRKPRARVVVIFRNGEMLVADGDTVIKDDDLVLVAAARRRVSDVLAAFRRTGPRPRRIMIAGGGRIGSRLAESMVSRYYLKLIERDAGRCRRIAETLKGGIVLRGDASDADLLKEEGIKNIDFFCAVTDDDDANVVASMLAKKLGARHALAIVNRSSYIDVAESARVDVLVSPAHVMIGAILAHIRRADVVTVHEFLRGNAEAIELSVHGDRQTSKVIGRRVKELPLPEGVVISAIARRKEVIFSFDDTVIQAEDRIVLFLSDKSLINEVEALFQAGITFL